MFYEGIGPADTPITRAAQIGYATSRDGVNWHKHSDNPILGLGDEPLAGSFGVEVPTAVKSKCYYYIYYGYGLHIGTIGAAIGSVRPKESAQ